ncbi:unnamed protein product [Rotaria sordida]|uniref:Mutator-like transposase domain-containing protein n=2 Tax=Rotaria sordida TaxID=392033 RepID=A0A819NPC8_9BILA|nr:unnamed protein product [Rotaria sordida]
MILSFVNKFRCPSYNSVGKMSQKVTQRRGLLYHITFSCTCLFETSFTNSTQLVHSATAPMDELNMMACVAANVAGIKRTSMTTILGMLNILPPVQIENWQTYQKIYSNALDVVKDESLGGAAEEAAEQSSGTADREGVTNIKVLIEGTWLTRRGHSSLHGVATVCSTSDPPKVLDFECLSRHCITCSGLLWIREHSPEMYQQLSAEHIMSGCEENHSGSSSGMEAAGAKLEDSLPIGGRNGCLTDDKIHQLTIYYGSAIRSHVNDLESMKIVCWGMSCSH